MDIFLNYHLKTVFATNPNIPIDFLMVIQIFVLRKKNVTLVLIQKWNSARVNIFTYKRCQKNISPYFMYVIKNDCT